MLFLKKSDSMTFPIFSKTFFLKSSNFSLLISSGSMFSINSSKVVISSESLASSFKVIKILINEILAPKFYNKYKDLEVEIDDKGNVLRWIGEINRETKNISK